MQVSDCALQSIEYDRLREYREKKKLVGRERSAFLTGGNSSCRAHIRQHYGLYQQLCKEKNIPQNHHAIPRPLWRKMQEEKSDLKRGSQTKLDGMFEKVKAP
jgi:hypothetical protein